MTHNSVCAKICLKKLQTHSELQVQLYSILAVRLVKVKKGLLKLKDDRAVKTALQVLKDNAENDFEKLAVARLETALFNPPRVEIIDDTHQKFNGVVYNEKPSDTHYRSFISLHRAVYSYYHGEIAEGYSIHHIDLNPTNNNIENLIALTDEEHHTLHCQLNEAEYICDYCGKKIVKSCFNTNVKHHFCNRTCKALWRNENVNIIEQTCVICGKKFTTRKRGENTAITCSKSCSMFLKWRREREKQKGTGEKTIASNTTAKKN